MVKRRGMGLDDSREALRAKTELAKRHARDLQRLSIEQRARALEQRDAEAHAVEAARAATTLTGRVVRCDRCHAVGRAEAIREATRRRAACLLCGGSLTPVP